MAMTTKQRVAAATALATAIAVPAEGLRQLAYKDVGAGILTTCYGHTGPDIKVGHQYSIGECQGLLSADMLKAISTVDKCQPGLPVPILAAFSDAAFNAGSTIACDTKNSTAARLLTAKAYDAACDQLPRWSKTHVAGILVSLPGLVKRREAERQLCMTWRQA
jgi:GH24 family phage-related lysozyme (muramidase)